MFPKQTKFVPKQTTIIKGWFHFILSIYIYLNEIKLPIITFFISSVFHLYKFKTETGEKYWRLFDYYGNLIYIYYFINYNQPIILLILITLIIFQTITFYMFYHNIGKFYNLQRLYCGILMMFGCIYNYEIMILKYPHRTILPILISTTMFYKKIIIWKNLNIIDNHDLFQIFTGIYYLRY
jgi:hypothetical protein